MQTWTKALLFLLTVLLLAVWDSQAQAAPTVTAVTPANVVQAQTETVTISGKGFKSGMLVLWGSQQRALLPHVVNQYKATVALDATTTKDVGFFTVSLLNKNGLQSNVVTVQVCQQIAVVVNDASLYSAFNVIGLHANYQLKLTGGCIY